MRPLAKSASDNVYSCIGMIVLTGVSVIIRFTIKIWRRQKLTGDDWICLSSILFFYAYCTIILTFVLDWSKSGSLEKSELEKYPHELTDFLKMTFLIEPFTLCVLTTVKLSILWFYYKIFASTIINRKIVIGTSVACGSWFIVTIFICIFQCVPMRKYWETHVQSPKCLNAPRRLVGYEVTNLCLDIIILCIPVPMVWRLQLKSSKKIGVIAIFFLGGFVCLASIIRITKIWKPPNINDNFDVATALSWSTMQQGVAIICACLPTMGPILTSAPKVVLHFSNWISSIWNRGHRIPDDNEMTKANNQSPGSVTDVEMNMECQGGSSCSWAHSSGDHVHTEPDGQIPPNTILVNRDIHVV
ncbi:Satratoxin biosynthesis SC1 cluster 4-like protein [Cladobotryum mycophilum]|uniref:Satratoxin biosynthesis SC1 cluster 4-like protein n=1 Tax=Cladobotryum mycophilum TaxID=491253 RepID=A0ABR0S944_9HYPO